MATKYLSIVSVGIFGIVLAPCGWASPTIEEKLRAFEQDPISFQKNLENLDRQVIQGDAAPNGFKKLLEQAHSAEEQQELLDSFIQSKFDHRSEFIRTNLRGRVRIGENDRAEDFVDRLQYSRPSSKHQALLTGDQQPWSDDYWAFYRGGIAARYADSQFPGRKYAENKAYLEQELSLVQQLVARDPQPEATLVDDLSPAEKYDLIVGDYNFTLSRQMIGHGQSYVDAAGNVAPWMGYCHGWAPASFTLSRPAESIVVKTAKGGSVRLYPSDTKAMIAALWANNSPETRFAGGRCNDKNPALDPDSGEILDPACNDTNAGTWHKVITNQIGGSNPRGFVMDVTYDYEVWNQPVLGYRNLQYFNPQTGKVHSNYQNAKIELRKFTRNKFKNRARETRYVVGAQMEVLYVVETRPTHASTDRIENDAITSVTYMYDLELDSNDNIVGGAWYQHAHPDFLWVPPLGTRAYSPYDSSLSTWVDPSRTSPPESYTAAARESSKYGRLLANVVEPLVAASSER